MNVFRKASQLIPKLVHGILKLATVAIYSGIRQLLASESTRNLKLERLLIPFGGPK